MTEAERRLWRELRELGLARRFRRQHPIGKHIVDPVRQRSWSSRLMADNTRFVPTKIKIEALRFPGTVIE
jgi:very-short-patch-repair endonuclease